MSTGSGTSLTHPPAQALGPWAEFNLSRKRCWRRKRLQPCLPVAGSQAGDGNPEANEAVVAGAVTAGGCALLPVVLGATAHTPPRTFNDASRSAPESADLSGRPCQAAWGSVGPRGDLVGSSHAGGMNTGRPSVMVTVQWPWWIRSWWKSQSSTRLTREVGPPSDQCWMWCWMWCGCGVDVVWMWCGCGGRRTSVVV